MKVWRHYPETTVSRRMDDEVGAAPPRTGEPGKAQAEEHALGIGEPPGLGPEEDGT